MGPEGYRAPPPGSSCSRCQGYVDGTRAILSAEGLPLCARCDAELRIAAPAPPRAMLELRGKGHEGKIALGIGTAMVLGTPLAVVGWWKDWFSFEGIFVAYGAGAVSVLALTIVAFARASRANVEPPPLVQNLGIGPYAPPPAPGLAPMPNAAARREQNLAAAGATMAATGCGAISLVAAVLGAVALLLVGYVGYLALKVFGIIP
jgi:hypothetical protein